MQNFNPDDVESFELTGKQKEIRLLSSTAIKHVLVYGGSRSGKTFFFCYAILVRALVAPGSRHAIFRRHGVAVKQSIGKDTLPKVVELAFPNLNIIWKEKDGYFLLPNGSEIWLAGLDDKDRVDKVLGKEFATLYFNEASEIPLSSYDVAQTRLAQRVKRIDGGYLSLKSYVDLNPTTRSHWTYRIFIDGVHPDGEKPVDLDNYGHLIVNPIDNRANLPPDYLASLEALPERQKKRFFDGQYAGDDENALWRREGFKRVQVLPEMARIVVAIDPATTSEVGSNETGIICGGIGKDKAGYIIADDSGVYRPEEWARRAIALYTLYKADRIVAEVNQGGEMVEAVLRAQQKNIPYRSVHASRGKVTRAEPAAALYERGLIYHLGEHTTLEDQMCVFTSDFDRKLQGYSPDRVDAAVWLLTDLFPDIVTKKKKKTVVVPLPVNSPFAKR